MKKNIGEALFWTGASLLVVLGAVAGLMHGNLDSVALGDVTRSLAVLPPQPAGIDAEAAPGPRSRTPHEFAHRRRRVGQAHPRNAHTFGEGAMEARRHGAVEHHEAALIGVPPDQAAEGLL